MVRIEVLRNFLQPNASPEAAMQMVSVNRSAQGLNMKDVLINDTSKHTGHWRKRGFGEEINTIMSSFVRRCNLDIILHKLLIQKSWKARYRLRQTKQTRIKSRDSIHRLRKTSGVTKLMANSRYNCPSISQCAVQLVFS